MYDFLKIHNPKIQESPTGQKILVDKTGGRKTYHTVEHIWPGSDNQIRASNLYDGG